MAASAGKKRHKSAGLGVYCVLMFLNVVPFSHTFSLSSEDQTVPVPHTAETGFIVLKTELKETCTKVDHVPRSASTRQPSNPFSIHSDGSLVIKTRVHDFVGDLFVVRPILSNSCQDNSTVSLINPIYVEIVDSDTSLHFVQNHYKGSIHEYAPACTKVSGIKSLYATCSAEVCRNNLDYRLVGTRDFYLETISKDGHVQLEIFTKNPELTTNNPIHNFIIVAQNSHGSRGYTNIEVEVTSITYAITFVADDRLLFEPIEFSHRGKRAAQETLSTKSVNETATGFLFSVRDANNDWKYTLASSTYLNAFAVSEVGAVSVAPGFELDYETLTANGGSNSVQLVINVLEKADDTLVKELIQPVIILDVNDEPPAFTNKPTPFLATVSVNAPANTIVYTLNASDPDAGSDLEIRLSNATDQSASNFFTAQIVGGTVKIIRIGNEQFSQNQEFKMVFIATDKNAPQGTTQITTAEVHILAGSRPPRFMEQYSIAVEEKNAMEQVIAKVEVYSFQQTPVDFTVLDQNSQMSTVFSAQSIETPPGPIKSCNIIVNRILDYETPPRTFNVKIRAQEKNTNRYTDQDVVIIVTDNNEYPPRFSVSTYKMENVREDITVGSELLKVTATDEDFNSTLTFLVDNDHFIVEADNPASTQGPYYATIKTNKKLDYDRISPKVYDFNVQAIDNGEIKKTGEATVRIFMTNLNDESPVFPEGMKADIRYNEDVGKEVYIVQATDADQGDRVTYAFVDTYDKFEIESATGRIKLRSKIANSQESITVFNYELLVRATDDGGCCPNDNSRQSSTGTVTVNILTDNINRPEFSNCLNYQPEVSEEKTNAFVIKVTATEGDYGANGMVTYSIREVNSKFRINSTTGDLYTAEEIDREALGVSKTVPVNVIATDGGGLQGTCSLLVKIIDINDNAPRFVQQSYEFQVEDTRAPDSVAAVVEATDADNGINAEVTYSFPAGGNPGEYFRFDNLSFTGQIKVAKALPQDAEITLTVQARDGGTPGLASNVTVNIRITSNPLELPPQWPNADYSATVNESVSTGVNIFTFSAQSRIDNNKLNFRVVDQNSVFIAEGEISDSANQVGHLRLRPGKTLDYETTESYSFTLRASDVNIRYSDKLVTVRVTDTNDNVPEFVGVDSENGFLDLSLLEGNYTGQTKIVGQIRAIDNDRTSPNNQIANYRILDANSRFAIDSSTGVLTTSHAFDREASTYIFTITVGAEDGAPSAFKSDGAPNTGSVNVKITIEDVNDNPPVFPSSSYTFEVPENTPVNERFPNGERVLANDPDSAASLTYSVSPLQSASLSPPFSIQPQTGYLQVAGALDYDKGPAFQRYVFLVGVSDSQFSSSTTVTINVKNVNDNSPVVGNYEFNDFFEENSADVGPIATVNATDIDGDIDGDGIVRFWYELKFTDSKDQQYFQIDQQSGVLSIAKPLDRDLPDGKAEFIFTVEVADEDPNDPSRTPRKGFGEVVVRPIDINDNEPFFPEESRQMTVMENRPVDALVGRVVVGDYDEGINAENDLAILQTTPNEEFRLDARDLRTLSRLDREVIDKYYIVMQAVDKGVNPQTGTGTLTITVGDVNDNTPHFNTSYQFMLSEHQTSGEVGRIQAYDADIGPNAVLTYTLDSADTVYFQMDKDGQKNQGILKVFQTVDYDDIQNLQRNFNLTAYAVDPDPGQNNEKRAQTYIEVTVTDYNDEVPIFDPPEKVKTVAENADVGTLLETFTATDRDIDPQYSNFEYFISRKSDPTRRFTINQDGEVRILNQLDREETKIHTIHILAIDNVNGSPQNTGTATLTVTVTDINDNCPDFAQDYSKAPSIMENENIVNSTLLTFSATDADDESVNGPPFNFELACDEAGLTVKQCSKFSLRKNPGDDNNRGTGTIIVKGIFDREDEKVISLPVKMCDRPGVDQQCCIRLLHVTINDKNDNKHDNGYQHIVVYNYKGLFGDFVIGKVNANDPDDFDTDKFFTLQNQAVAGYMVSVDNTTGEIRLKKNVPEMSFEITVQVKDQEGLAKISTVRIQIIYITDDAVYNSGSIRIDGVNPEAFLFRPKKAGGAEAFEKSMMESFQYKLAEKLYGPRTIDIEQNLVNVQILSIMGDETHTDVRFAAHGSPYYQSSRMDGIVSSDRTEFEQLLRVNKDGVDYRGNIDMVPIDMCKFETCKGGCYNKLNVRDSPKVYNTKGASYVGVDTNVVGTCGCKATTSPPTIECTPGYCYHGGVCSKNDWGVVSCECPDGFKGARCQKLRQSFDGTGYALYKELEQCEESRTSIEFMTKKGTALILYNGPVTALEPSDPTDFLLLELVNGRPRLRINHGTGEIQIQISGGSSLSDGAWHRIDIFRDKKNVRMVVDYCVESTRADRSDCEASGVTRGENIYINVVDVLQLGGRMSTPPYPDNVLNDKFDGCMKNLIHNAEVYDLSTGGQFPGATDGCDREDEVCGNGCGNGQCLVTGVSVSGALQGTCICDPGYKKTSLNGICANVTTKVLLKTQSYMDWQIKNTFQALLNSRKMKVSFHFRTRDTDGLMFYVPHINDANKYILFKVVSSKLQVSYNLGDDAYDLVLGVVNVADGYWHGVTLERYGKEFILRMDSGEGIFYIDTQGPVNGVMDFTVRQDQFHAGASLTYASGSASFNGEEFEGSCFNDIRYDNGWFPMANSEELQSPAATIERIVNAELGCNRSLCTDTICQDPFICKDLWGDFSCVCKTHFIKSGHTCLPVDYCASSPCFGAATCQLKDNPAEDDLQPFVCLCPGAWYGPLCQYHPSLKSEGDAFVREGEKKPTVGMAGGVIAGIILGIIFLIVAIIIVIWLLTCRGKHTYNKKTFNEDDIRGNIMNYDEEGADHQRIPDDIELLSIAEHIGENSGKFESIDSQMPETDGNIQQMPDEREVTNDMQQLSLDQPSIYGGNSSSYSKASQQEMKQAFSFPEAQNVGAFGNTRKQGEYESNEFSPDLSGGSNFAKDVSDSLPQRTPGPIQVPRGDVPDMDQLHAMLIQDTQEAVVPQHNVNFVPPDSINSQDCISARNDRLEQIFKSEHDIKGRLKILTAQNIEDLLDSCGSQPMFSGGFGDIYVSKEKIPGLNRKIAVKKVDLKKEEAELKMRTLTSEKLCARSVHFAIVPLYGIREDSGNRIFYFLSPYMVNGSLNQVIEDDNKRLDRPVLHSGLRVRILFQIASAIDFLHTPLKDIRGIIIHGDIKSLNIVLDEAYNARLIDFGLAREMKEGHDHTKTTSRYVFTPGYGKMTRLDILAKHDDYRSFGVVIRELLTGRKPSVEGCPDEDLINQGPKRIEKRLLGMIKPPVGQSLVELSRKCIKDETVSSKEIVMTLKKVLKKTNTPRWGNLNEADNVPKNCDMCLENDSVGEKILTHYNCQNNMNICVSCMRNSYCNPIHCHSCEKEADSIDTTIYPTIGHGWAALLIAGDDSRDCVAKSLKADVDAVFKVITSKCPLVMGVSVENVQIVNPVEGVKKKMKDVVKALQKVDDIQTLLVYISSHYVPEKGGFELKSKPEKECLSILELQEIIADILQGENQRTIVLLDCCSSPAITIAQTHVQDGKNILTDKESQVEVDDTNTSETSNKIAFKMDQELIVKVPGIRIVQMNACRPNQKAIVEQGGSLFRKILLQSLTRNALDEPCVNFPKCKSCSLSGDFVTVEKIQTHIASHWDTSEKCNCVSYYHNVDHIDVKIGYVINFKVDLQVTYRYRDKVEHDKIPQRMFGELSELQIVLFDKYVEKMGLDMPADGETADGEPRLSTTDFYDILCIEVEKGPKKHQRDRLNTLERVMAAWNAKRELVVTLRTLPEVTDGTVGIFLPSDQSVKPILDILQKDKSIRCVEEDHATKYVIKLDDEFNDFSSFWKKVEKQKREQHSPSIETFDEHSVDLEEALNKLDKLEKKLFKELQIVFPCTNVDGTRNHRRNFLCYQMVRHEDC